MTIETKKKRTGWWKEAIVYQIWPKSFFSGNGTPTGDIKGIISKLDYIKQLGANTIWLSPHYSSPMIDEGYDISDYENVNPMFGTLADAEQLIKECHDRGMRIIFDLVINHTSDQHKWFQESRSSRSNPKRDWFIWRPARYIDGKRVPHTNWLSCFNQSAWEWDELTEEYYLHLFAIEQPDINWRNEECRKALLESSMEFWLKRGLDGFRVDTVNLYSKPEQFTDAPITFPDTFLQPAFEQFCNGPEMHNYLREMGDILEKYDAMTVGELGNTPDVKEVLKYVGFSRNELSMVFQFETMNLGRTESEWYTQKPWSVADLAKTTEMMQTALTDSGRDGWPTSFLENHDQGRSVSRFGNDLPQFRATSAKMLSLLVAMASGTMYVYQGQELAMTNVPASWDMKEYLDIGTINYLKQVKDANKGEADMERAKAALRVLARDHARTPCQWTDGPNAGFTAENVKPWMRINDNYKEINAAQQLQDKESVFWFWQKAIELRKQYPELFVHGKFSLLLDYNGADKDEKVLAFAKDVRAETDEITFKRAVILLNLSQIEQPIKQVTGLENGKIALSSYSQNTDPKASLLPYEGRVVLL